MYYYIYDEFVSDKKHERDVIAVENRVVDLGIGGRVARLALFRNAEALVVDELKRGQITTVVVVGNDQTLHKVLDVVADYDVAFGVIPIGGAQNTFARMLGVPQGVAAVDVLSARNVERIDTGTLNGQRFVTGVTFPKQQGKVTCDRKYTIETLRLGTIQVRNLVTGSGLEAEVGDPTDGLLEAIVTVEGKAGLFRKTPSGTSILGTKELEIEFPEVVTALADGKEVKGTHFSVTINPLALQVITGKERMF